MATLLQRCYYKLRDLTARPDERGKQHSGYWQAKVRDEVVRMCAAAGGRFLEIGCGEGIFLVALIKNNPRVEAWGVDGSDDMLALAKKYLPEAPGGRVHFVQGQGQKLPFEDGFFDTVAAVNLFICVKNTDDARAIVMEAARVLKSGGRFIAEFRNKANPVLWVKYRLARFYDATLQDHPLSTYKIEAMRKIFAEAGFCVAKEHYLEFPLKKWAPIIIFEAKKHA